MIYISAILLGILFGVLLKGKVSNLLEIKFQKVWLILSAAVFLLLLEILSLRFDFIEKNIIMFQGINFILLFISFWFNRRFIGIWFIGFGAFLNMLVMLSNGGKMPVSTNAMQRAKLPLDLVTKGIKHKFVDVNGSTSLSLLADNIVPPGFWGIGMKVVSIGDIIVVLGLFLFILQIVRGRKKEKKYEENY
jgi:hypothetical protein